MILAESIVVALGLSLLTGGSMRRLATERLIGEWFLIALLPGQLLWPYLSERMSLNCAYALLIWLLMMAALAVVLMFNASRRWALAIAALGIAANVLVIGLNQAMPVSINAISEIGGRRSEARSALSLDCLHEEMSESTLLPFLGDVIAVPGPVWHRAVVSAGDVLLSLGLALWIFLAMREQSE